MDYSVIPCMYVVECRKIFMTINVKIQNIKHDVK